MEIDFKQSNRKYLHKIHKFPLLNESRGGQTVQNVDHRGLTRKVSMVFHLSVNEKDKGASFICFLKIFGREMSFKKHLHNEKPILIFRRVSIMYFGCVLLYVLNAFIAIQNLQHHCHQQNQRSWNTLTCEKTATAHWSCIW